MHGRFRREGEGSFRSPQRSISWHMHPTVIAADSNSFFKDGRKISVGDSALFEPPQDSPPFIGLIRRLKFNKDNNNLQLGVNWLYRPAELKLGKGSLLDSAPNEIFYSFHKDEIPAASLLHPCKVAFLPRGAELPTGTSSFVCRRVYDIENKCLWWLTDQDYINERQEEVDQLLHKTRTEMHGNSQTGGRSPKQANGPTSASQMKLNAENAPNIGTSFPSQSKGKKRERGDHSTDPVKRERPSRTDDSGSTQHKTENNVKSEIAKITEKGGLVDFEGVEKLVQLMQPDFEKKLDLISRSLLAGVVAATEKVECLNRFMHLKGLSVFDEWLQDIHKGKLGGGINSKDGDKSVEDFLLVLLRALDKLPVNLPALQTCNIGRSVNHLRSHKNVDIQRKARSLVDTWKKRVQAEMTSIDAETGSAQGGSVWSSKSRLPESSSHSGSRTPSGSDVAMKSSITQHSASKTTSAKSSNGENNTKSASSSPGAVKPSSPPASVKESQTVTPDAPLIREDRSSSSNQSHSYSVSISTKEEVKSSTAVSAAASKISSSSRNRKGGGGLTAQKETSSSRSLPAIRSSTSDKLSPSSTASERVVEGAVAEAGIPKLIVKISNRSRSPTKGVSGVSPEASPPLTSDKLDQFDNNSREKNEALHCNNTSSDMKVDSCNDRKDIVTGCGDGAATVAVVDEEKSISTEDSGRLIEGPKKKLHENSFSPMNALIESCAKYSEAHSSLSPDDDVGMNLLASVATGEMSRLELISPTDSTERSLPTKEEVSFSDDAKSKPSPENQRICNEGEGDQKKQALLNGSSREDGLHLPKQAPFSSDMNSCPSHTSAEMPAGNADSKREVSKGLTHKIDANEKIGDGEVKSEVEVDKALSDIACIDNMPNSKNEGAEEKSGDNRLDTAKATAMLEAASPNQLSNLDCKSDANDGSTVGANSIKKINATSVKPEIIDRANNEKLQQTSPRTGDAVKVKEKNDNDIKIHVSEVEKDIINRTADRNAALEGHSVSGSCSDGLKSHNMVCDVEKKEIADLIPTPVSHKGHKVKEVESASAVAEASPTADAKVGFDLNEGFTVDDGKYGEPVSLVAAASVSTNVPQFSLNPIPTLHPASITVAAAAKGPFVPPEDLLRSKGELGWKGSAATSAFRPAEPRKAIEPPLPSSDASTSKNGRVMLDIDLNIDLNVPDEKVVDEVSSMPVLGSGGLDLDLNRVDESNDNGQCSTSRSHNEEASIMHVKQWGGLPSSDVHRGFDLNGPGFDDGSNTDHLATIQQLKVAVPPQLPPSFPRPNNPGLGSLSSWFPPQNTYSNVTIPSVIPDRADQPYPVIPPGAANQRTFSPAGMSPFMPDVYRGSVLSSSPAVSFPSSPFQFPVLPYGHSFPLPSANFPASYGDSSTGARLFTPPMGAIPSHFQRPFMVGLPDSSGLENSRKWLRQGLDLNAGPGGGEGDIREETLPSLPQHSASNSQVQADEQARLYQVSGNNLKRSEPDGGWDKESFRYKQSSWQ